MAKKGRKKMKAEDKKGKPLPIRPTQREREGFQLAAQIAGTSLSSWITDRLRFAAVLDIDKAGQKVPFLAHKLPHSCEAERELTVAPVKLQEVESAAPQESSELPPEPEKTAPASSQEVEIVKGNRVRYENKKGLVCEGTVVAELEESQEFVVSNGSDNEIVPTFKVKAKIG